jgi:hypothetical protein
MIRVSTTQIESFRRVMTYDYATEQELVESISGKFAPNWKMEAGTAWQRVLEHPGSTARGTAKDRHHESGDYRFYGKAVDCALALLGPGLCEVKASRIFTVDGIPVNVVAQADHVHGLTITDNKAKFSALDARDYEQSLQWRFYLAVHGSARFRYILYDFADPKSGYCELRDIAAFSFFPYVGMEEDCREWLGEFVEWARSKTLLSCLERKVSTAELAA